MSYSRPGRSMAGNVTGLLGSIGDTIGEMGGAGDQYVDTFRRSMAPTPEMNDSASLLNYADWARRNGYDEEANQYMVLGATQQKAEGKKSYTDELAVGTEKLRGLYTQLAIAKATPNADPNAVTAIETQINTIQTTLNDSGASNIYGVANAGDLAGQTITSEMLAAQRAAMEAKKLHQDVLEGEAAIARRAQEGKPLTKTDLPHLGERFAAYTKAVQGASLQGSEAVAVENERWQKINTEMGKVKEKENTNIANGQVQVIHQDLIREGSNLINDDDLTDFLEEDLTEDAKKSIDSIVVSKAIMDPDWVEGDAEAQRAVIKKHFIDQYSQHFREDFGQNLAERQGGKALTKSDAIADYAPNMNPDYTAEEGGGKEQYEAWYENAVAQDPTFTREEARAMWDEEHRVDAPPLYPDNENPSGYSGSGNKAKRPIRQRKPTGPPAKGNFSNKAGR